MNTVLKIAQDIPRYLWSAWGALASIFLLIALWGWGFQVYGELVLPSPKQTFITLWQMLADEHVQADIYITLNRAFLGFVISVSLGTTLGLFAGLFVTASIMSRPIVTILMGMPPIAWIILAMMWFGVGDETVIFTVIISAFPIVFIGSLQGARTLGSDLEMMSKSFKTPTIMRMVDIYFPHMFSYVFPAWVSSLGQSWKIVVMAELLASSDGIGAALAISRSQLDTSTALALVVIMVTSLLLIEYLFMEPIKREIEEWRN